MTLRSIYIPDSRNKYIGLTFLAAAVVLAGLLAINWQYLFHTRNYEWGDMAANSLQVLQAKKFRLYQGVYSRWLFHHPGPALLYFYAWGEMLFWQGLHICPTPFDAQVLVVILLTTGFLAAGIGVAARWVRSAIFIPLALLVTVLDLSCVSLDSAMYQTWGPYVMPIPFFCLLVAAASVGAGQADDLPLLVFTGCFFIHDHVAHPLFVFPLFLVAYVGLWRTCRRVGQSEGSPPLTPWRLFPRTHYWVAAIIAVFILPIVIDICHGASSSMALVLHHLRTHHGEHHPYIASLQYLIKFGAFKPPVLVDHADGAEIWRYLRTHAPIYLVWLAAIVSPLLAFVLRRWRTKAVVVGDATPATGDPDLARRWHFIRWLAFCLALCTGLTLFWGHIQDGEMFHYNAWFDHGLFLALAFLGAVSLTDILETGLPWLRRSGLASGVLALVSVALLFAAYRARPERFTAHCSDSSIIRAMADTVATALAEHPDAPRIKFIDASDGSDLPAATAIALLLRRAGYDFRVAPEFKEMFEDLSVGDDFPASLITAEQQIPMEMWRIVRGSLVPEIFAQRPLMDQKALVIGNWELDPSKDPAIILTEPQYNGQKYCFSGFEPPAPVDYVFAVNKMSLVQFVPIPVAADSSVEIHFDFFPILLTDNHRMQRLIVTFNGSELATFTCRQGEPPPDMRVLVPAALWNAPRPMDFMTLQYPDSIAPKDIDDSNQDPRKIAFGVRKITFRTVAPAAPAPTP